jgi:uncharacterized protein YjbI with pentapeptide repeats
MNSQEADHDTSSYPSAISSTHEFSERIAAVKKIFLTGNLGTFAHPSKEGFVAIAKLGKGNWNAWSKANTTAIPDFSGVDFEQAEIDFSGFSFERRHKSAICVDFTRAKFNNSTKFVECIFGGDAIFACCEFRGDADFSGETYFDGIADFSNAVIKNYCNFSDSRFSHRAIFSRLKAGISNFSGSRFSSEADFNDASFGESATFRASIFMGHALFEIYTHANISKLTSTDVTAMDFSGALFKSESQFTNRHFAEETTFGVTNQAIYVPDYSNPKKNYFYTAGGATRFYKAPNFHGCKFHQSIDFHYTKFVQDYGENAAICYRTLRMAMEQIKSIREEQRFFRMEIKAESTTLSGWKIFFSTLYEIFSDYGFSVIRPLLLLVTTAVLIGSIHGALSNYGWKSDIHGKCKESSLRESTKERIQVLIRYVIISTVPIPGTEKTQEPLRKELFENCKKPWVATVALIFEMGHKATSILATFLLGLALRNLFKMKS